MKDRIGVAMIDALEAQGKISPGRGVLVEPTSGNTGIALAFVAAARGYKLILVMPESMSIERRKMLALLGAELVLTPAAQGMKGAIAKANEIVAATPGRDHSAAVREPRQSGDPSPHHGRGDLERHRRRGRHRRLRRRHRRHDHRRRPGAEGAQAVASGWSRSSRRICRCCPAARRDRTRSRASARASCPPILDRERDRRDRHGRQPDGLRHGRARRRRIEGVPVGISSGAAIAAAIDVGRRPENAGKTIVVIIPSFAERYLSTALFEGL